MSCAPGSNLHRLEQTRFGLRDVLLQDEQLRHRVSVVVAAASYWTYNRGRLLVGRRCGLLLLLREHGLVKFSLDAVNSRGETAAQMSKDPETTDVLMLVRALDGADMRGEQRAAFLSDGRASGFTQYLMIRILVGAENQANAVAALLKAAKKTARWDDARAAASEVMIGTFDQIGADGAAVEAYLHAGMLVEQKKRSQKSSSFRRKTTRRASARRQGRPPRPLPGDGVVHFITR